MGENRWAAFLLGLVLLAGTVWAAPRSRTTEGKLRCTLTNKVIEKCCCEQRAGKLYCPLAKKTVETCCCEQVKGKAN